ncbi:MAG: AAA family ATPase [Anaerolineae bacterium]|nr:AAA family ATPase [Anaerolineae bacterium]
MSVFDAAPYRNLTLTGSMGVGKTTVGRMVAERVGAEFFDLENEILTREGQSADQIRELYGEARLKALETDTIHDLSLRRHAILAVSGPAMMDQANRNRLVETGPVLCLTCTLNEILRRVYVARGAWFHNPANRGMTLSRLKREMRVVTLEIPQLDTSRLSTETIVEEVIAFWFTHARL